MKHNSTLRAPESDTSLEAHRDVPSIKKQKTYKGEFHHSEVHGKVQSEKESPLYSMKNTCTLCIHKIHYSFSWIVSVPAIGALSFELPSEISDP